MFKNYFIVAIRHLWKNKIFSAINIFGLAIGLCSFLLIALYVLDELSYDKFNRNAERIYRINSDIRFGGVSLHMPVSSDMMGYLLKKDYAQVEQYTRIYNSNGNKLIKKGSIYINENNIGHADSTFFEVFTFPALAGDTRSALNEPNTVVVTESMAKKYFGTADVVGKSLETNDNKGTVYKITAVIRDMPKNSHFHFDALFSMKNVDYTWGQLTSHNFHTYLLLKPGTDYKAFEKNFDTYIDKYVMPQAKQFMNINSLAEFKKAGNSIEYSLMPLLKIHLFSDRSFELGPSGNIQYVYIFSAVALFVLIIACINFMNLTTARSAGRAKEVGIRKVLGTERKNLITQFLSESVLLVFLSLIIALVIAYIMLPLFNDLAKKSMGMSILFSPAILPLLIIFPFLVGSLAGSYPAFYLSAFRPVEVLKGKLNLKGSKISLRSLLVVFQFVTSIILIVGTIVIYRQLNYIQTRNMGFNKDQVLIINNAYALKNNVDAFKNEALKEPGIISGTLSSFLPVTSSSRNDNGFSKDAVMDAKNGLDMQSWQIDYDYFKTLGIQFREGRNFSKDFGADSSATIINETTAKIFGYENPVGKKIYGSSDIRGQTVPYTIIGVVKDFNFESLHQSIGPLAFFLGRSTGLASFKVSPASIPSILKHLEEKWRTMAPAMPFSYRFMDDSFNDMYQSEQRVGKTALVFSIMAILIACLGLFGLAAFIAEQRTKEIGIRKILGASVTGIIRLLSTDFMKLVSISFVIAAPLSWYFMNKWLQDFAYRIDITWWIFVLSGVIAIVIALVTVSTQAIKAALTNPVTSLRSE